MITVEINLITYNTRLLRLLKLKKAYVINFPVFKFDLIENKVLYEKNLFYVFSMYSFHIESLFPRL